MERPDYPELLNFIVRSKWYCIDAIDELRLPDSLISCPICGNAAKRENFRMRFSTCHFGGGRLERYECLACGVIFGPLKMLRLSEQELIEEYQCLYSLYAQDAAIDDELAVFQLLKPKRNGTYLHYGLGASTEALTKLRGEGWQIYCLNPYASVSSPYVYTRFDQIKGMKFDGIMSHHVIEHLNDPVDTFNMLKGMLEDGGRMVHSTPCFSYRQEFSRFHLFFYTGNSVNAICQYTGLRVVERIDRTEYSALVFICS